MTGRTAAALAGAAIVALAAPAPGLASHGPDSTGGRDFAVGSAKNMLVEVTPFPAHLRLAAHGFDAELGTPGGPELPPPGLLFGGTQVTGHAVGSGELPTGAFHIEGEVTCLKVVGNRAPVKYRFKTAQGPGAPPAGWGVQVFVEDNGPPSGATPDGNATDAPLPPELFEPQADQCELPRGPLNPVDSGSYVVHDADPAPLTLP